MEAVLEDLRSAYRSLAGSPAFAAAVILTLALGIGINTSLFSVVDAVLLRPLPFADAERLVTVDSGGYLLNLFPDSPADFLQPKAPTRSFEDIGAYSSGSVNLTDDGQPERVAVMQVTGSFFSTLGVAPALGRVLERDQKVASNGNVAVISYRLWQRRYGQDQNTIGKSIRLNAREYTIVGIMPAGFDFPAFPGKAEIWVPLAFRDNLMGAEGVFYGVIARLAGGISVKQGQAEMDSIYRGLQQNDPSLTEANRILLQPLRKQFAGDIVPALRILVIAAGFVLLIACANVANLQLARGAARQKEMAIRSAIGAGRFRLLRQWLVESTGLAVTGGVAGLLLAGWATQGLVALGPTNVLSVNEVRVDWRVLVFNLTLSLVTGVLFGLAPAIQFSKPDLIEALKAGSRTSSDGGRHSRLRNLLVVGEVTMAMVLLVGSGLLLKSFVRLISVDPGFKANHMLTMEVSPPAITYPNPAQKAAFYQEVIQRITEVPGVDAVGMANHLPLKLTNGILFLNVYVEGKQAWEARMMAGYRVISPDYFRVMSIPILRGRPFSEQDDSRSPPVVIISERLSRTAFGEEDAIGKRLIVGSSKGPVEIVGVVGNVRHFGLDDQPGSEFYLSYLQKPAPFMNIVIRSRLDPRRLAEAVRGKVWSVDPTQPVYNIRTMEDVISDSLSQRSFLLLLTGLFGLLAVSLASVGIYGVMSHSVNQRTHEIGVRMALGADRGAILRLILWRGLALVMPGVVIGGLAAAVLGRFLNAMLYETVALDLATFAAIPVLLILVASVACYLPSRRATLVDPLASLRWE